MDLKTVRKAASWQKYHPPVEAADILANCKGLTIASTTDELIDLACGGGGSHFYVGDYENPGNGMVNEATVARARERVGAKYPEACILAPGPGCMWVCAGL